MVGLKPSLSSFLVSTLAVIWSGLNYDVGFWVFSCIGVSSVHLSMLQELSKALHNRPSGSKSDGIMAAFGSKPVVRRLVTSARIISP